MKLSDRFTRRLSIRKQIVMWNVAALALLLGALGAIVHYTVRTNLMNSVDRDLLNRTNRPPPGPPGYGGGPNGPPQGDGNRGGPGYPGLRPGMTPPTYANPPLSGLPGDRLGPQRQVGGPEGPPIGQGPQQGPNAGQPGLPGEMPGGPQGLGNPDGGRPGFSGAGPEGRPLPGPPNPDQQGFPGGGPGQPALQGNTNPGIGGPDGREPGAGPEDNAGPGQPENQNGEPERTRGRQSASDVLSVQPRTGQPENPNGGPEGTAGRPSLNGASATQTRAGQNGNSGDWPTGGDSERPRAAAPPPRRLVQIGDNERPQLFDLKGVQVDRNNTHGLWDKAAFDRALHGVIVYSTITVDGDPLRVISRSFSRRGHVVGVIQAPYHLEDLYRAMDGMDRTLLALVPVGLGFAWIGGMLLTGRVLRPLRHITGVAAGIGADRLEERLPTVGNDEFSVLAVTFNGMLERVQAGFREQKRLVAQLKELVERQRRFTADASHELKTPLTIIKANTSLCLTGETDKDELRQSLVDIDGAANTMSKLVQDLLLLASSDEGRLGRNLVKLPVTSMIKRARTRIASTEGPCLILPEEVETLTVYGNEDELVRVFGNLLENACRYTPASGTVTVKATREAEMVTVTVADTGTGIAAEHLPHLGERFYRVDSSRTRSDGGTGLGLAICLGIINAHDGTISFASELGKGTTVTVRLPAAG